MRNRLRAAALIVFTLTCANSFAQQLSLYWGKEVEMDLHTSLKEVIGETDESLLMLQSVSTGYFSKPKLAIAEYGLTGLNFKSIQQVTAKGELKQEFLKIQAIDSKLYLFTTAYNKETKINTAYAQELDLHGKPSGPVKKLDEIKSDSKKNRGSYEIYPSNDSTKILIVNNPPFDKYGGEKFEFKVLDENLGVISNKEVQLPYKDKKFASLDYQLTSDGTVYMLARIDLEKDQKEKGQADFYYEILSISPDAKGEVKEYELKLPDRKITDIAFEISKAGNNILCAGFYADVKGKASGELKGTFFTNINIKTQKIEAQSTKDFEQSFIEELTTRRRAAKGHGLNGTFILKRFISRNDGSILVVAENSYDYVITYHDKNGYHREEHFVRNNIIAFNIAADGNIQWTIDVPKFQHTVNDGAYYSSFVCHEFGDKVYFMYNDNPKNMAITDPKKFKNMGNPYRSVTTLVEVDNSGRLEKVALQNNKEAKFVIVPTISSKLSDRELLLYAYKHIPFACCFIHFGTAKYKLGKITF